MVVARKREAGEREVKKEEAKTTVEKKSEQKIIAGAVIAITRYIHKVCIYKLSMSS
jgi:hypothetical protein